MYDAIIVGARPAGSATALLLARQGYRILLVDKARFPSDVPRGHVIGAGGIARLKKWGILEKLQQTDTPAIGRIHFDAGYMVLEGAIVAQDGINESYAPRHALIDAILYGAAQEVGVEVRERFKVEDVLRENDRVVGIRGKNALGREVREKAKIVIGADGMHSTIAKLVQAPMYMKRPKLSVAYLAYYRDLPVEDKHTLYAYERENRIFGIFPTNNNLSCVFVQIPYREFADFRRDVVGNYERIFEVLPSIPAMMQASKREGPILGASDLENFFRKPYGAGWALVGDAGYHKDPCTAQGFIDAFLGADLLSEALGKGFSGECAMETALAEYEYQRNQAVLPMYDYTCEIASFAPPSSETLSLFAALQQNQEATNRFLSIISGTVSLSDFYAPANIQQLLGKEHVSIAM